MVSVSIVDYLNECKIAPPDTPPDLPIAVEPENQVFLDALLIAFGLMGCNKTDSKILKYPSHIRALAGFLEEDDIDTGLTLLYRGTRDGFEASSFHEKCDGQGSKVTIARSSEGYIFGGYSDVDWKPMRATSGNFRRSEKAFLFGLSCKGSSIPLKLHTRKRVNTANAMYTHPRYGPCFGTGPDLSLVNDVKICEFKNCSVLGNSYAHRTLRINKDYHAEHFTGSRGEFKLSEMEVFKVAQDESLINSSEEQKKSLNLDVFPEDIRLGFIEEQKALAEAAHEVLELQDAFDKEQAAVQLFCQGSSDDQIVRLNVSGRNMAIKQSTISKYPDSVLYKQFADPNWNHGGNKRKARTSTITSPRDWDPKEVVAWIKMIHGLSEDITQHFDNVNGAELLSLDREDVEKMGIQRPATVALVIKAIDKLRDEEGKNSATLIEHSDYCFALTLVEEDLGIQQPGTVALVVESIRKLVQQEDNENSNAATATLTEHSDYCFGKIIDHMRLQVMSDGDVDVPKPLPPEIREPDCKRFQRMVEYYFPGEDYAGQFLAKE